MAQRFLPLALILIAFAGALAISSWRAIRSHSDGVPPVERSQKLSLGSPVGGTAVVTSASLRGGASLRTTAGAAPASNTTAHEEVSSAMDDSTGRAAFALETSALDLTERENPAAPHSARTR
jgi:hypothetical protein